VDVDPERGWFLMRDAGTRLRDLIETPVDLYHWERVLPEYARLQLEVAPHADEFLVLGTPDERLTVLPGLFRELLAGWPHGLTDDEHRRALDAVPRFRGAVPRARRGRPARDDPARRPSRRPDLRPRRPLSLLRLG
jgi:hypothetical protein